MTSCQDIMLLLLCAFLWMYVAGDICPYKECDCSGNTISCEDKGLNEIPHLISGSDSSFTTLLFSTNSIKAVPDGCLPSNLQSLSFVNNPIVTVNNVAFSRSSTTLKSLFFSNARFTRIPYALHQLQSLTTLLLSNTKIEDWDENVLKHIGQTITTLTIDNTNLITWPSWLQYFPLLTELSMDNNGISDIPDGAFNLVTNTLMSLSLDGNKLKAISPAVSILTSLQTLSLTENNISDTLNLPSGSQLMSLSLSGNKIYNDEQFSYALQSYSESLRDISLDNNKFTKVPDLFFLEEVEHLDLSHNLISQPSSGSLPSGLYDIDFGYNLLPFIPKVLSTLNSAVELSLPWNNIRDIHGSDFPSSATTVDLTHNLITTLTSSSFPTVNSIQFLKLSSNPISAISTDAFNSLHDLTELYLVSAKLARVPLALVSLKNLKILNLTDNKSLVCTCLEERLGPWTRGFSEDNLMGSCGVLSVYTFFTTLSPACPKSGGGVI
ncbi:unnamed protein product [Candidula unifasciata]|uniref:Uncharacterized protein n=1 Tax=Candidula unifasciata TaxID=100452 RepID=A0A8S3ZF55_9EUPU|nr:unnamed protein product [Candidula unifasciata]